MYLKNLTVLGFKSFADKTSLNFQPGVTAIVGPNGCGKSNVSDAIRWVLGEQSARALRGGEMADVIFNGTDSRKSLSLAEVSLTIGGVDDEQLRAAGVEIAYNEVMITRRVFRDGSSEYFLNKTACRLKDIQQLFMGTGVGRSSYSIMAQGNITQILSSKPEERRLIFEEAAGITKYKTQKREALRKLEATEQNLLRVADLIREVKRQIGSLQRQAGKARRYKQLLLELQHLDTQLARHQFDLLRVEIEVRQSQLEKSRAESEVLSEMVTREENQIHQLREAVSEQEQEISQSQQQGLELKSEAERHQSRIQYNEDRMRDWQAQNAQAIGDIAQADERRRAAEEELAQVSSQETAAAAAVQTQRAALQSRREAMQAVEEQMRAAQEALRQAQSESFDAAQQLSRARNQISALDLQKEGNAARLDKLSAEKAQLEQERVGLQERLRQFSESVEAEIARAQGLKGTLEERQQRLRVIEEELSRAAQALEDLLRQQAENRSRLQVLEQLDAEREGFGAGTISALNQNGHALGLLADRLRVPAAHVAAVEAALGGNLQLVLTEREEAARQILDGLRAAKSGRAGIAALELRAENGAPAPEAPAGMTTALSVVEADGSVQPLLRDLLGGVVIAPDLAAAGAAWRQNGGKLSFVTPEGELLDRNGVFTGGQTDANGNGAASSILGRKNQIAELRGAAAALRERVEEAGRHRGTLLSEQTCLQTGLRETQTELRAQEVSIATRQGEHKALQNAARVLEQKIETVVYEIGSLAAQQEEGLRRRQELAAHAGGLEAREQAAQAKLREVSAALESFAQQREAASAALTETKVALATQEQVCAAFGSRKRPLEQRIGELKILAEQKRREIDSFTQRHSQAELEITDSRHKLDSLGQQREQVNARIAQLMDEKSAQEEQLSQAEETLRERRRGLAALQEQRGIVEVELAQKNMAVDNLRQRVQEKYQLKLEDIRSECLTITLADEGPAQVHTLTPEEMAASGMATDWAAVAQQTATLQRRIEEMGPVNLVAIDEYEETEQRHQFLTKQNDDLTQAKTQLLEVIQRINTQTRAMFTETFEKIRTNFLKMFSEIFGGGKADLILLDNTDVLESGIDIVARPPGKQLQSISLLSGGEQTMTAVALLFSIYQVRPSPFCVLDELDAALDESNINRFIQVLQRFLVHSQFIIITHNKRTIGMADVLYGVTMQEQGVSKIVSVKFHKTGEEAADHKAAPIEAPKPSDAPSVDVEEDKARSPQETIDVVMAK